MPRKTFVAGEVLTASDVQEFLADQAVMTFADSAARGSAIGSAVEGMVSYLEDTDAIEVYAGTAVGWVHAASAGTPSYRYVHTVYFTSNGTFSKGDYPWLRAIRVKVQGAGGAGGGAGATTAGQSAIGTGGGSGAYGEIFITDLSTVSASATVTVGSGGAGVSGDDGNDGGASNFDGIGSVAGGRGGTEHTESVVRVRRTEATVAAPSGYDLALGGNAGGYGLVVAPGVFIGQVGGQGGPSLFGGVNRSAVVGAASDSNGFGSGGSGASHHENNTAVAGADGRDGIVIVELYA